MCLEKVTGRTGSLPQKVTFEGYLSQRRTTTHQAKAASGRDTENPAKGRVAERQAGSQNSLTVSTPSNRTCSCPLPFLNLPFSCSDWRSGLGEAQVVAPERQNER